MKRTLASLLTVALLLVSTHRLPAPIQEIPESPTPAPEQSAKPKPKRTIKPKITNENSENSSKTRTSSPTPKGQATPNRNAIDGTWIGTCNGVPGHGNVEFTLIANAPGTLVIESSSEFGSGKYQATCDGETMRWMDSASSRTLKPNSDGKTALVTVNYGGGLFGIGAYHSSVIFRRMPQ